MTKNKEERCLALKKKMMGGQAKDTESLTVLISRDPLSFAEMKKADNQRGWPGMNYQPFSPVWLQLC